MFKHSFQWCKNALKTVAIVGLLFAVLLLRYASAQAQYGYSNATIYAGVAAGATVGSQIDVGVFIYEDSIFLQSFGSFRLLITYDPVALTLVGVTQGGLFESCGWESFQYQDEELLPDRRAIRIMATADLDNGPDHPSCYLEEKEGALARMTFVISGDSAYLWPAGTTLKFYWDDCLDNTFYSVAGDSVLYSNEIIDWECYPCPKPSTLGTSLGAPDSCLMVGDSRTHARLVSFCPGGVYIWPPDSIDARGDINCNGIGYEVADAVWFTNCFLEGLSAFGDYVNCSTVASDVNADGIELAYQDLVYLWRIIIGDAQPFHKQTVGFTDAYFQQDLAGRKVSVSSSAPLAGAFMLIRGNVSPTFLIPSVGWIQAAMYDGTYTRILILGDPSQPYGNGVWFTYEGPGMLEHVETADWDNTFVTAHITHTVVDCGDFDGSGSINIGDVVYIISHIFTGGFLPLDIHGGDVNCDGLCNISDVVYVLHYIFSGGPAPCENCK